MDIDDLEPRQKETPKKDLSVYSIEELNRYVEILKAEILRTEAIIKEKDAHKNAASNFFKR